MRDDAEQPQLGRRFHPSKEVFEAYLLVVKLRIVGVSIPLRKFLRAGTDHQGFREVLGFHPSKEVFEGALEASKNRLSWEFPSL